MNAKEAPKCGSTGTSDLTTIMTNILEETLGVKFQEVRGYPGGVEIDLAMEKGEIHCRGTGYYDPLRARALLHLAQDRLRSPPGADRPEKDPRLAGRADLGRPHGQKENAGFQPSVAKVMLVSATLGRPMITTPGIPGIGSKFCATPI